MNTCDILKRLKVPNKKIDVVIDTDTYNELDDQFAVSYLLNSGEKLNTKAIYAAPFFNSNSSSPADGMEKSYREILKLLTLAEREEMKEFVFKGSDKYLDNESTPVISDAANDLAKRALNYTSDSPLYVVAIGAITNIASAILLNPDIKDRIVIVWLGGHTHSYPDTMEFNMRQDFAAARVVMGCGTAFVQLPCNGCVKQLTISKQELEHWLLGKNKLATYLAGNTINAVEKYIQNYPWTRTIWDISAVAWLLNDNDRFMSGEIKPTPVPENNGRYSFPENSHPMMYIYDINRDEIFNDMIIKLTR